MNIGERLRQIKTIFTRRDRKPQLLPTTSLNLEPDQQGFVPETLPVEFPTAIIICRQHKRDSAEPCGFSVIGQIGELGEESYPLARYKDHPEAGKTLAALVAHHTDMEVRGMMLGHRNYAVYAYRDPNLEGEALNRSDNLVMKGRIIMSTSGGTFIPPRQN